MKTLVAQFSELPTTCVSDALNGLTNLDPAIKPLKEDWKVCGPAFPVKVRAADNLMVLRGIREAKAGDVLVIDAKGYLYHAVCGDFVVGLMKTLGLAGVVIDGAVRDILGIKRLDFPVFCRGTTVAASGKSGAGAVGVPISCGGVEIHPGDIILGDADGVVVIPGARGDEILQKAKEKLRKDEEREQGILGNPEAARAYLDQVLSDR
ncbi:MAG: RraA family protein [Alicyclobacillaceae bacterium]|nr:RraA family protein [Alicyclobacillaceae bacterium]